MSNHQRRRMTPTLGAAAGGLLAAVFGALAASPVACADDFVFTPDNSTFIPLSLAEGFPPLFEQEAGFEDWNVSGLSPGSLIPDAAGGDDTLTTLGGFTNYDLVVTGSTLSPDVPVGTQIDLATFGFGFGNELYDIPSGPFAGVTDVLLTPFIDVAIPL